MTHTISLRISQLIWRHPQRWAELLGILQEYREVISEVAYFTGFTHPPRPLAEIQDTARKLQKEMLPAAKALGLRAGINHLATLGHLDENAENSLQEPWQHLVDLDGSVLHTCYCAADPRVLDYIRQAYIALAKAGPDFLWVDDDMRMEHHAQAVKCGCFCPFCLETFTRETGRSWTREVLREAFNRGARQERLAARRQWQEHLQAYIVRLLTAIRKAVDTINPALPLGQMTGEIAYSGYGFGRWAEALAGKNRVEVKWRPGGGFYSDDRPLELLFKAHSVGRQVASLPASVVDVQWEHENFPYQVLRKSRTVFQVEMAAALGAGCTGVALNVMGTSADPLDEYRPLFEATRKSSGFLAAAARSFGRTPCTGIWIAHTPAHFSALNLEGDWETAPSWGLSFARYEELFQIGLPPAHSREGAAITLLTAEACNEFSPAELLEFLKGGVWMDGAALERLHDLGLGEQAGFRVRGRKDRDSIEVFAADLLNGRFAGWSRDCRPSFWPEPGYLLEPCAPEARPLSELIDFAGGSYGPASGVFENSLGGRVAVQGYFPWTMIQNLAKASQMHALARWLAKDTLPGYVSSYHRAALWCRNDPAGQPAFLLLNASIDPAEGLELHLCTGGNTLTMMNMDCGRTSLPSETGDGQYSVYQVDRVGPWEAVLIKQGWS